jgi:hypothetical protein
MTNRKKESGHGKGTTSTGLPLKLVFCKNSTLTIFHRDNSQVIKGFGFFIYKIIYFLNYKTDNSGYWLTAYQAEP